MFCTECGIKNSQESNFCKQCGQRLDKPTPPISEEQFNSTLSENDQVGALMERAYFLRVGGDLIGASTLCEQALKLSPDSASAHSLLGQIYEQQGETAKAVREFEMVLAHNPASIADRVKLDQLRNGNTIPFKSPHVVVTHPVPSNPPNVFAMIGVGAALILVGAVAANQFRLGNASSNEPNRQMTQSGIPNPANANPNNGTIPAQNGSSQSVLPAMNGMTSTGAMPNAQNAGSPFISSAQMNAGNNQATQSRTQTSYPSVNTSNAGVNALPVNTVQINSPAQANRRDPNLAARNGSSGTRTRLNNDDGGVVQGENGFYKIDVDASGNNKNGGNAATRPTLAANTPDNKEGNVIKIKMAAPSGANSKGNESLSGASSAARTAISIGKDMKLRGEYNRAIRSFKTALASAGDETGFVYQEIGKCFQDKGDKDSATVNYESAIGELQKLVEAGRSVDNARAAIRACQTGIKVCKSE